MMSWRTGIVALALALACGAAPARGELISGSAGLEGLGAFTGTFDYFAFSAGDATLTIELTNTSPGGTGYLTAFVFNNPKGRINAASLLSSDADFVLLGAAPFADGVPGNPFGQFDFGAGTGGSFEGGGKPSKGLGVGLSATFTFTFSGTALDELTAGSFFEELSVPPGQGQGPAAFVARFRGFDPDGSDKVPGALEVPPDPPLIPQAIPEPSALLLGAVGGLLAGLAWRRRRRAARAGA